MLLAAGFGTRLLPLTEDLTKALVPVGDRSVLMHAYESVRRAGCTRVTVNAHHHAAAVVDAAKEMNVSIEDDLLGTAGGIERARERGFISGDVLVWNTDMLDPTSNLDPSALLAASGDAALLVRARAKGEGSVGIDRDGRIVRLRASSF